MKTTNMITMKTIYTLVAFLGLQFNSIYATANSGETPTMTKYAAAFISGAMLTPATPQEALFEDLTELPVVMPGVSELTPSIPMMADFSDGAPDAETSTLILAPVTPIEADFEDGNETLSASPTKTLAPVTPADADFADQL